MGKMKAVRPYYAISYKKRVCNRFKRTLAIFKIKREKTITASPKRIKLFPYKISASVLTDSLKITGRSILIGIAVGGFLGLFRYSFMLIF